MHIGIYRYMYVGIYVYIYKIHHDRIDSRTLLLFLSHTHAIQHAATSICAADAISSAATHCDTLQDAATHRNCNILQPVYALRTLAAMLQHTAAHCNTIQHDATRCNTLQHTATRCNTLQHQYVLRTLSAVP